MTTYIFIFEDESVKQSQIAPTEGDFLAVEDGCLSILKIDHDKIFEYSSKLQWVVLDEAEVQELGGYLVHV